MDEPIIKFNIHNLLSPLSRLVSDCSYITGFKILLFSAVIFIFFFYSCGPKTIEPEETGFRDTRWLMSVESLKSLENQKTDSVYRSHEPIIENNTRTIHFVEYSVILDSTSGRSIKMKLNYWLPENQLTGIQLHKKYFDIQSSISDFEYIENFVQDKLKASNKFKRKDISRDNRIYLRLSEWNNDSSKIELKLIAGSIGKKEQVSLLVGIIPN